MDMELKDVGAGRFPNFGAIFMSNRSTMQECFERELFGLPAPLTDFVRGVKVGMILFLFEYEKRKLYGVFEATSDGEKNIVPHAYSSSGRQFPAQVRFTTLWHCNPLSEHEFRHAIIENYYDKCKLNFGLSQHQVQSLLVLFDSRKGMVLKSPTFTNSANVRCRKHYSEKREVEKERPRGTESSGRKLNIDTGIKSVISTGDADLSHSNLKPLACSDKAVLEDEDSLVGCPHMLCSGDLDVHECCNPEATGFQYSSVLVAGHGPASGHEYGIHANHASGNQPVTSQEEPEKSNVSSRSFSSDLADFIPLASPDDSDLADAESPFSEAGFFENNQAESANFECNKDLCLPKPHVPIRPIMSDETFGKENLDHPFAASSSDGVTCCGIVESPAAGSLWTLDDCHLKDGAKHFRMQSTGCQEQSDLDYGDEYPSIKGLYADILQKRTCVFSHLDLALKDFVQKKEVDNSVDEIMEELEQRHGKLRKMEKQVESFEHENEDCNKKMRISVFSRLASASKVGRTDNSNMRKLRWETGEWRKTMKKDNFTDREREDYSRVDKSVNKSLEIMTSKYTMREKDDSSRVDKSVHEIMEELWQRDHKWRGMSGKGMSGKDKSLGQGNEDHCAKKRASVFLHLTRDSETFIQDKDKTMGLQQGMRRAKANVQEKRLSEWTNLLTNP